MKKIEIIWRHLLYQVWEKEENHFVQKKLAKQFGFSLSTISQALKAPRKMGAVRVSSRFFTLSDPEKLLYYWASVRNLEKEVVYRTKVNLPILEIEGQMPARVIFGGYSAYRLKFGLCPADYDKVIIYSQDSKALKKRFPLDKGYPNLWVLKADPFLKNYGQITPLAQIFVDLWNLPDWYAKEFINNLREKLK